MRSEVIDIDLKEKLRGTMQWTHVSPMRPTFLAHLTVLDLITLIVCAAGNELLSL
jgi:hypothetical protein